MLSEWRSRLSGLHALPDGQHGCPPACADAVVANCEEAADGTTSSKHDRANPAHADFLLIVSLNAGFADVRCEGGPVAFVVDASCPVGAAGLQEAVGPVARVESEGVYVAANNALAQDAAGKQTKPLLLQRNEVTLADFGNSADVFQRNAARLVAPCAGLHQNYSSATRTRFSNSKWYLPTIIDLEIQQTSKVIYWLSPLFSAS